MRQRFRKHPCSRQQACAKHPCTDISRCLPRRQPRPADRSHPGAAEHSTSAASLAIARPTRSPTAPKTRAAAHSSHRGSHTTSPQDRALDRQHCAKQGKASAQSVNPKLLRAVQDYSSSSVDPVLLANHSSYSFLNVRNSSYDSVNFVSRSSGFVVTKNNQSPSGGSSTAAIARSPGDRKSTRLNCSHVAS